MQLLSICTSSKKQLPTSAKIYLEVDFNISTHNLSNHHMNTQLVQGN
jgi:hypothetical protein